MARLVNTDSPSTERQRLRRTIAEALKRLAKKRELDTESKDLAALIVLALREIEANIDKSASSWDKRHYYVKADRLRSDWDWTNATAERMTRLIHAGDWSRLPVVLASLAPRFADIKVAKLTRSSALWNGAYERLMSEKTGSRAGSDAAD